MRKPFLLVAGLIVGALASEATFAARFTTHLDAIEGLLATRQADTSVPPKLRKAFKKSLKKLGKDTANLGKEIATAKKVVGTIVKKAPTDAELNSAASAAVGALATDVAAYIEEVTAAAEALDAKRAAIDVAERFLSRARDRYSLALSQTALPSRLTLLGQAWTSAASAQKKIDGATGGGGGGGGGTACGPTPTPAGLRTLGAGETVDADDSNPNFPQDFATSSVIADVGKFLITGQSFPTLPTVLRVKAFDCTNQAAWTLHLPFPPVVNTTYRSGQNPDNGTGYATQSVWDGATQVFPGNGTAVTVTAFDEASKEITLTFTQLGAVTNGTVVLKDWRDLR